MENYTYNSLILQVEGFKIPDNSTYPVFFVVLFLYIFLVFSHVGVLIPIIMDKNLHNPMYLLFLNLLVNDLLGNSCIIPRLLVDTLRPPAERLITYYECVVQAFITHWFCTASHTVLMIMSFDRYVAICNPLRYASIMTNRMVISLTVLAWSVAFILVSVLLGLTVRLSRCRTVIRGLHCSNVALFKLSCESVVINNIYGFTFTIALFTGSIGSMLLTYAKITVVCLTSKSKSLNRKALHTCFAHLSVFLILLFCGMLTVVLHRFPQYAMAKETSSLVLYMIPSTFNPIIYGIQSKEIQKFLSNLFKHRMVLKRVQFQHPPSAE